MYMDYAMVHQKNTFTMIKKALATNTIGSRV